MPDREVTTTRIEKLEQDLAALTARVAALESRAGGSPTPLPPAESPSIEVGTVSEDGPFGEARITGSGFIGGAAVVLTIRSVTRLHGGQQSTDVGTMELTATPEGKLDDSIGLSCPMGATTNHTIQAREPSSGRVSNKVATSC